MGKKGKGTGSFGEYDQQLCASERERTREQAEGGRAPLFLLRRRSSLDGPPTTSKGRLRGPDCRSPWNLRAAPSVPYETSRRLLSSGRVEEASGRLEGAGPGAAMGSSRRPLFCSALLPLDRELGESRRSVEAAPARRASRVTSAVGPTRDACSVVKEMARRPGRAGRIRL